MRMIVVILTVLVSVGSAAAQTAAYDLTVTADQTKTNFSPWDGVPGLGGRPANINAAPDIAVCIVQPHKKPECLWRPQGRRLLSVCQNSHTCKFENVALPPVPFGLLFIDIDIRRHDLIDIVVLTGNATAAGESEIERALLAAISELTPALSESAKERGLLKAKTIPLQQCVVNPNCRLTQSQFNLRRRD